MRVFSIVFHRKSHLVPTRVRSLACLYAVGLFSLLMGCSGSEFNGSSAVAKPAPSTLPALPSTSPAAPTPTPTPPVDDCTPGTTITNVRSLTGTLNQSQMNRRLTYELSLQDCPGTVPQTVAKVVSFDIDAQAFSSAQLLFQAKDNGAVVSSGRLDNIQGSDLFGKSGAEYWHYRTDQTITVRAVSRTVVIEIDMSNMVIIAPFGGQTTPLMTIPTYFKFGDAQPVKVDVQVTEHPTSFNALH